MPKVRVPPGSKDGRLRIYRSPADRDRDLLTVSDMYLRGSSLADIHQHLNEKYYANSGRTPLTIKAIEMDLIEVRKRWMSTTALDFSELKGKELARIDKLERAYWDGWESSREVKTKDEEEESKDQMAFSATAVVPIERNKKRHTEETRDGDPKFLDGIQKCIQMRCQILGLFSPEKFAMDWKIEATRVLGEDETKKLYEDLVKMHQEAITKTGKPAQHKPQLMPQSELVDATATDDMIEDAEFTEVPQQS